MTLRTASLLSLTLALVACTSSTPRPAANSAMQKGMPGTEFQIPTNVTSTPTSTAADITKEGESTQVETLFSFALAMPPRAATLPIAKETVEGQAVLQRLDPKSFQGTNILAAYEFYWAGGGFQAVVRKSADAITFEKRDTSEGSDEVSGGCGPWTNVGKVEIGPDTHIVVDDSHLQVQKNMIINCPW